MNVFPSISRNVNSIISQRIPWLMPKQTKIGYFRTKGLKKREKNMWVKDVKDQRNEFHNGRVRKTDDQQILDIQTGWEKDTEKREKCKTKKQC